MRGRGGGPRLAARLICGAMATLLLATVTIAQETEAEKAATRDYVVAQGFQKKRLFADAATHWKKFLTTHTKSVRLPVHSSRKCNPCCAFQFNLVVFKLHLLHIGRQNLLSQVYQDSLIFKLVKSVSEISVCHFCYGVLRIVTDCYGVLRSATECYDEIRRIHE